MKPPRSIVRLHFLSPFSLSGRLKLKRSVVSLFEEEHKLLKSLDYIFCSDSYLLQINQNYLKHDTLTDIITFDLSASGAEETTGEIYISVERVKENAKIFHTSFQDELVRVVFHGALHLCGYKDKQPSQKKAMRAKENEYLKLFHVK